MLLKRRHRLNILHLLLTIILLGIAGACANKSAPTGGPKDETPPNLISSNPENGQLNFNGKEVTLEFDEYVKTDKPKEQIIITPRIDGNYTIKQRRDRIILSFDSAFAANTTYTINFRESIVDITESNPADNLIIAFSTGSYIDSLSISGYVQNVLAGMPSKKALIGIYPADDTTTLFKGQPVYFTESNDSGRYVINNIKDGRYRIFAFKDSNRNLKAEPKNEPYGFYPDTLALNSDLTNINMNLVNLDIGEMNTISARPSGTTFDIRLNKYILDYELVPDDTTLTLYNYYADPERQTISVYNTQNFTDSTKVFLTAYDSVGTQFSDTLWVQFEETRRSPDKLTMEVNIDQIPVTNPQMTATINFNKPIQTVNKDSAFIYLDSLLQIPLDSLNPSWNNKRSALALQITFADSLFRPSENNQDIQPSRALNRRAPSLILGKGAFIDVENDSSASRNTELPFVQQSSLAVLAININASTEDYFIQLLNGQGQVIAERQPAQTVRFRNLPPGEYTIRAVIDVNQNGQWDPGNILENQLPENIVYFTTRNGTKNISLRANFDVTENFRF